jgi:hypothetical protein
MKIHPLVMPIKFTKNLVQMPPKSGYLWSVGSRLTEVDSRIQFDKSGLTFRLCLFDRAPEASGFYGRD